MSLASLEQLDFSHLSSRGVFLSCLSCRLLPLQAAPPSPSSPLLLLLDPPPSSFRLALLFLFFSPVTSGLLPASSHAPCTSVPLPPPILPLLTRFRLLPFHRLIWIASSSSSSTAFLTLDLHRRSGPSATSTSCGWKNKLCMALGVCWNSHSQGRQTVIIILG